MFLDVVLQTAEITCGLRPEIVVAPARREECAWDWREGELEVQSARRMNESMSVGYVENQYFKKHSCLQVGE